MAARIHWIHSIHVIRVMCTGDGALWAGAGAAGILPTETASREGRFEYDVVLADRELRLGRDGAGGAAGVFARVCTCVIKYRKCSYGRRKDLLY